MTPAEELRAAATRLEELAAQATPGPWMARYTDSTGWPVDPAEMSDATVEELDEYEGEFALVAGTALPRENGRDQGTYASNHVIAEHDDHYGQEQDRELWASLQWAALLNPQVAEPLVAWLRQAAEHHGVRERAHASNVAQLPRGTEPWPPPVIDDVWRHALDFARVVNRSSS